jgi:hypothetical protein
MPSPEAYPEALASIDEATRSVELRVDASVYGLDALYGASYVFIDRCYVLLEKPVDGPFRARLHCKEQGQEQEKTRESPHATMRALAEEFMEELISCAWRARIAAERRTIAGVNPEDMRARLLDGLDQFEFVEEPGEAR